VYAIVRDAKKYPFGATLDFGKGALGRSISRGICVMTYAGWKIITLENLKENTEIFFAISRFSGSAVGRFPKGEGIVYQLKGECFIRPLSS
jgi:hypothetical protein